MSEVPRRLAAGTAVEGCLGLGEVHAFAIALEPDRFFQLAAEQRGLDVLLRLLDAEGRLLTEVDTPIGAQGREEIREVTAPGSSSYRLEVHPAGGGGTGSYRLCLDEPRPATDADRVLVVAERTWNAAEGLRRERLYAPAYAAYARSRQQWQSLGDTARQALAAYRMGWMKLELLQVDDAQAELRAALELLGEADPVLRATIWNRLGRACGAKKDWGSARQAHEVALQLFRAHGDIAGEATALHNLGMVCSRSRDDSGAQRCLREAVALWHSLGNTEGDGGEANALTALANVLEESGCTEQAAAERERAAALVAGRQPRAVPAALAAGDAPAPAPRGCAASAYGTAVALARFGAALAAEGRSAEAARRYAEAFAPGLDPWTLVLRYELDDESGILWAATASGAPGRFVLAARDEIEAAVQRLDVAVPQAGAAAEALVRQAAASLSRLLLAPVAGEIAAHPRLVLLVDGGLARVPFAMLPEPRPASGGAADAEAPPLLAGHEIVILPGDSAEAVFDVRKAPTMRWLELGPAAVGDPVLRADDPRLAAAAARSGTTAAVSPASLPADLVLGLRQLGLSELPLLPHAHAEIEAVVPEQRSRDRYAGLEATLDSLRGEVAPRFRMVHVAALAVLTAEASGLVLSCFDESGQPRDGFLRLTDLAELDLPVKLLTVTGIRCSSADGSSAMALVKAARQAGAERIVTSLWSTDGESAVELMRRFYQELIGAGARPPAALRRAQLAVAASERWSAPRHWAGFFFSGDWSLVRTEDSGGDDGGGSIEASDKGGTGDAGMLPTDIAVGPSGAEELPPLDLPPVLGKEPW